MKSDLVQVLTTIDTREAAEHIARVAVERRLAACAQISGPIRSIYRWKGKIETADEWLCTLKTTSARFAEVERAINELHSYETPEIVAIPAAGSGEYLSWVEDATRP